MEVNRSELMLGYVEPYYRESRLYKAQNNAKGQEFNIIHAIIEELPNQFNPQTATWGLRLWEELLDIDRGENNIEERRSQVFLKMVASQMMTPITLERLLRSVTKTEVKVTNNVAPYTFAVDIFIDINVSLNCHNVMRVLEEVKPAHLHLKISKIYRDESRVPIRILSELLIQSVLYPRANIPILLYQGVAKYNGIYKYNGYMTDKRIDLYPTGINIASYSNPLILFADKLAIGTSFETRTKYHDKLISSTNTIGEPAYNTSLKLESFIKAPPKYIITLTTYKHISKYNGRHCYNGSRKYDAKIIKENL